MVRVTDGNNLWHVVVDGRIICTTADESFARNVAASRKRKEQESEQDARAKKDDKKRP